MIICRNKNKQVNDLKWESEELDVKYENLFN